MSLWCYLIWRWRKHGLSHSLGRCLQRSWFSNEKNTFKSQEFVVVVGSCNSFLPCPFVTFVPFWLQVFTVDQSTFSRFRSRGRRHKQTRELEGMISLEGRLRHDSGRCGRHAGKVWDRTFSERVSNPSRLQVLKPIPPRMQSTEHIQHVALEHFALPHFQLREFHGMNPRRSRYCHQCRPSCWLHVDSANLSLLSRTCRDTVGVIYIYIILIYIYIYIIKVSKGPCKELWLYSYDCDDRSYHVYPRGSSAQPPVGGERQCVRA